MTAAASKKPKKTKNAPAPEPSHPADAQSGAQNMLAPWKMGKVENVVVLEELSSPPVIPMKDMPIGAFLDVTILRAIPSTRDDIKSPLIVVQLTGEETKLCVPGQAVIASTLLPDYDKDDAEHRKNPDSLLLHRGKRAIIKRTGTKLSPKWKADDGQPRKYPVYEITIVEAAKGK